MKPSRGVRELPTVASEPPPRADPSAPIAMVVIDDNRLLLEGIVAMVRTQPDFRVLSASVDVDESLEQVRAAGPDVVLLDFELRDRDSLRLTATVDAEFPSARVVVMGLQPLHADVAAYVRAGAAGFIMKDASFEDFLATIRAVASGAQVLPPELTRSLFTQIMRDSADDVGAGRSDTMRLTDRERQVVELLGRGQSNKQIALGLNIAIHTVKSHVHNILEKLALRSRLEVAAFAHRLERAKSRPGPSAGPASTNGTHPSG